MLDVGRQKAFIPTLSLRIVFVVVVNCEDKVFYIIFKNTVAIDIIYALPEPTQQRCIYFYFLPSS